MQFIDNVASIKCACNLIRKYYLPIRDFRGPPYAPSHPSHEPTKVLQVFSVTVKFKYFRFFLWGNLVRVYLAMTVHPRCQNIDTAVIAMRRNWVMASIVLSPRSTSTVPIWMVFKKKTLSAYSAYSHFKVLESPKNRVTFSKMKKLEKEQKNAKKYY